MELDKDMIRFRVCVCVPLLGEVLFLGSILEAATAELGCGFPPVLVDTFLNKQLNTYQK